MATNSNSSHSPSLNGSDSPHSFDGTPRRPHKKKSTLFGPLDDLESPDIKLKNTIHQEVMGFKNQLLRLRRVLQEVILK